LLNDAGKNILMTFKLRHKNGSLFHLQNILKESIEKLKDESIWKRIVINVTSNKHYIPNLTYGVEVRESVSGKHSEDKKHFEDAVKKLNKKYNKDMKDKFK
jgi:hypothetical protein